jgi:hypothetical protein
MNRDEGTFLEAKSQALELFEEYWGINMDDVALFTSELVSSYHSRMVKVNGDICLGKSHFKNSMFENANYYRYQL